MSATLEATREQIAALAVRPADEPVLMVNLLKFKTYGGLEVLPSVRTGGHTAPATCRCHRPLRGNRARRRHR